MGYAFGVDTKEFEQGSEKHQVPSVCPLREIRPFKIQRFFSKIDLSEGLNWPLEMSMVMNNTIHAK